METVTFAEALVRLGAERLTALLQARPDVLVEPIPRSFEQLARRLNGVESLSAALELCTGDMIVSGRAVALLNAGATVPAVAELLGSPEPLVTEAVDELCTRGLAWRDGERIALPDRLAAHLTQDVDTFRPVAVIARQSVVDDLRAAVRALGGTTEGLRKPQLVARLAELMADRDTIGRAVAGLSRQARRRFDLVRQGHGFYLPFYGTDPTQQEDVLVRAGLLLPVYGTGELPREVAVAAWGIELKAALTGPPGLPDAEPEAANVARSAAEDLLRGLTGLLDEARASGLTALKKGGVGTRERARLAKRLSAAPEDIGLWIDLASAAGLLARAGSRYAPTAGYDQWRESAPGDRWAAVARAWWDLEFAPTYRKIDDDTEAPPPVPLASEAGMIRRALLRAAAGGRSVEAAGMHIGWFCPLQHYPRDEMALRVHAAVTEARSLGVVSGDRVSDPGEHLVAGGDDLGRRCAALLPEAQGMLVLQSDLTAVASGQPSAAAARLLAAAAVPESHGVAATWRFSSASVRAAFDAGWSPDELRAELRAISDRELPQPLDYLISDVARRHGSVRVRGLASCIVGSESEIAEILHTRSLRKLQLSALAPTVLASPFGTDRVLAGLRKAGFAPLAEDADGVVIVEKRPEKRAPTPAAAVRSRPRATAAELARLLLGGPGEDGDDHEPESPTHAALAALTSPLDSAELALLADAIDNQRDVSILYRDKQGNRTVRDIRPRELYGRWLDAWCHLKNAQRDFAVANIEAVAPAG
ncbi:helicase-associated domain-containing protein [Pseudonocardia asaccharolytica]|nr:helicase-associated domain-containing protein [Pseudonocardia asaccharolytica]